MIKFEVYFGQDNAYHWRLKAANGEIVCWSEGYATKQGVMDSLNWVKRNAVFAFVSDLVATRY